MDLQHWQFYVTQTDSTVHSYDKTGQLRISPNSSGLLLDRTLPPPHQTIAQLSSLTPFPSTNKSLCLCHCSLAVACDHIKKSPLFKSKL